VRRLLIAAVLVVLTSLNVMDGVACPDGCTHDERSSTTPASSTADRSCIFCLGGVDTVIQQALCSGRLVTRGVAIPQPRAHLDAPPDPLDHPPRP